MRCERVLLLLGLIILMISTTSFLNLDEGTPPPLSSTPSPQTRRNPSPTQPLKSRRRQLLPDLATQLAHVMRTSPVGAHYGPQGNNIDAYEARADNTSQRPHHHPFHGFPEHPPEGCPAPPGSRPDKFCQPNLGRDWSGHPVLPLPYAFPAELFTPLSGWELVARKKMKDCASIVPRIKETYTFKNQTSYLAEYERSYYCLTYKKGGWDVLRHYEIIAAGCVPYMVDLESIPEYSLVSHPKQLLLAARDLPGVEFDCVNIRVLINHDVFNKTRYAELLDAILVHARTYMTTVALARYVISKVSPKEPRPKILFLHRGKRSIPLRAQGSYSSWMLFHGLKTLLGKDHVAESHELSFLYDDCPAEQRERHSKKNLLYGGGFGYAYMLRSALRNVVAPNKYSSYDFHIYGDVASMMPIQHQSRVKEIFVHPMDIVYARREQFGYDVTELYRKGIVLQREIMDCTFYTPGVGSKAQMMKRCVWLRNRNCFDEVNIPDGRIYRLR